MTSILRFSMLLLVGTVIATGCVSTGEHQRLMSEALARQKADYETQLRWTQDARLQDQVAHKKALDAEKDKVFKLERDLAKLGFDLSRTKGEMGSELAEVMRELEQLRKQREHAERAAAAMRAVADKLRSMIDAGTLEVVNRKGRLTLKLPDNILFPSASKKLKPEGKAALLQVIEVLKGVEDREFLIAGHTDNVPTKGAGGFRTNWELSTARAVEVVNLMTTNGVPPEKVAAAGYGEFDPVADNSVPEGRAKNRRLEIILMPKIEDIGPVTSQ